LNQFDLLKAYPTGKPHSIGRVIEKPVLDSPHRPIRKQAGAQRTFRPPHQQARFGRRTLVFWHSVFEFRIFAQGCHRRAARLPF
jgi:hypothetical protein